MGSKRVLDGPLGLQKGEKKKGRRKKKRGAKKKKEKEIFKLKEQTKIKTRNIHVYKISCIILENEKRGGTGRKKITLYKNDTKIDTERERERERDKIG